MNYSNALRHAITTFREQLERRQQQRRKDRLAKTRAGREMDTARQASLPLAMSRDVKALFDAVAASVAQDRDRYVLPVAPVAEVSAEDHEAPGQPTAQQPHTLDTATVVPSMHVQFLWDRWHKVSRVLPQTEDVGTAALPPAIAACNSLVMSEIAHLMEENTARPPIAPQLVMKLRQAIQAFSEERHNDALILLKNVLHSDPHNHMILMILSQMQYAMAGNGMHNLLHEARDNAQHSIVFSEKLPPGRLAFYRYLAIVSELPISAERALEWLRETDLLDPRLLTGKHGLLSQHGLHLRAWAILAGIPASLWGEQEFTSIRDLMIHVNGGAAVYLAWLRTPLLDAAAMGKTVPILDELEVLLHTCAQQYMDVTGALRQLPLRTSDKPWLLRVRYLHTLVQVAPIPNLDHALCNVALDGQSWSKDVSPDPELHAALGMRDLTYWRLWCLVITPYKDIQLPYLLPADETILDGDLIAACDQMLETLQQAEKQQIRPHLWNDLKPWMTRWQMDHLLAAGTGSNKPRTRFAPSLSPYTHLYRLWQEPVMMGLLASDLIVENARRGGFASLFEIAGAFEGAHRLLESPVHGLVPAQKRALAAAHRYNPRKFKSVAQEFGGVSGNGMMMVLMPLGLMGMVAGIVTFSSSWGQALGLILALAGVAGILVLNIKSE